jgi:FAD/FMN-containing dehydrogenase
MDTSITGFRGRLVTPDDSLYDEARRPFNGQVWRRPALIAQCARVDDVIAALAFARENALEVAVRSGGHSVSGWSGTDGGLVIDLCLMAQIHVDPNDQTAWIGPGARAGEVVSRAATFGLAPVTGVTRSVGLGGLLTGLGEGYLTPRFGYGTDNVLAFELVTADGDVLHVSADSHADLFWGMRGAGANFGVVTAMKLRLHPSPPQAMGGAITFAEPDLLAASRHVWKIMRDGSPDYCPIATYYRTEDGPLRLTVLPGHVGPAADATLAMDELRTCADSISDDIRSMSYTELITGPDDNGVQGVRQTWDLYRLDFDGNPEQQIAFLLEQAKNLIPGSHFVMWRTVPVDPPSPPSVAPRLPGISVNIQTLWHDEAGDAEHLQWLNDMAVAFQSSGIAQEGSNAVNHIAGCDAHRVESLYGKENYERLMALKATYDPTNFFRRNYNVPPAR